MTDKIKAILVALGLGGVYTSIMALIATYSALNTLKRDLTLAQAVLSVVNFFWNLIMNPPSLYDILAPYLAPVGTIMVLLFLSYLWWGRIEPVLAWLWKRILEPLVTLVIAIMWAIVYIPLVIILMPINYLENKILDAIMFLVDAFHQ